MSDATQPSIQEILLGASERTGQERLDYIRQACRGDTHLQAEVESLLSFEARTPSILDGDGLGRVIDSVMGEPAGKGVGIGDTLGPYTLVDVIGEGGMGVVFRASQSTPIAREVALKLVRRGFDTYRVVARFEAERQVLARMDHPGIARVYDAGATPDGRPYFVMELVAGQPVTAYADAARLTVRQRVTLLRQVCLAVQHAHQKGVIHRDLKPSNILASARDGGHDVKVIDFGIAKAIVADDSETLLTREGQVVGTPNYMSPEQAGIIAADVDTRTDVYALGVVLYELLAGRRPHEFARATPADIQRVFDSAEAAKPSTAVTTTQRLAWATDSAPVDLIDEVAALRASTPSRLKRDLVGDLDNIVMKAIEKSPDRRYASMEQFADDLARFLDGRPVLARPASWTYEARKFAQRHTLGVAVACTVIVFVAAFVAMTIVQSKRLARERDRAVAAEQRARLEAETASRTTDFLMGIFRVSDPSESAGREVTALELLDNGAREIGTGLSDQPALQSRLMVTMGNVYKQLGIYDAATTMLEQAVSVRERTPGTTQRELSDALDALGDVLRLTSNRSRAREVLSRAVELQRADPSVPPEERASSLNNLGLVLLDMADYAKAEALLREALAVRREVLSNAKDSDQQDAGNAVAGSLSNLGLLLNATDRLKEGESVLREALALRESATPPRLLPLAFSRNSLAMNLIRQARFHEAEVLIRQVVTDRTTMLGADHPRTLDSVSELAVALHDQGEYAEAESHYRRVMSARATDKNRADYAIALNNLASLLEDRGDFAGARSLLEESLAVRISVNGPKHPSVATAQNNLGRLLFSMGQLTQGRALLEQALATRRERFGNDSILLATTRVTLARLDQVQGRLEDAQAGARAAVAALRAKLTSTHPSVVSAEVTLGRILLDLGQSAEAVTLLRHAVEVRSTPPPPSAMAWRLAEARVSLGRALIATGKAADGRALIRTSAPLVIASPSAPPVVKSDARYGLTL